MAKLEDNFNKLESIIDKLENGDKGLEESFKLYEQGMKLLAQCNSEIDRVEKRLIILQEEADETADGQENM